MVRSEPVLKGWLADHAAAMALGYALVPAVLLAAFVHNHRRLDSRIRARLSELAEQRPRASSAFHEGEPDMLNVLVPIDGSDNGLNALRHAIDEYRRDHDLRLHLLHVQPRLSRHIARFVSRGDRAAWHAERADAALASARELLERAKVPYAAQWRVGDRAQEICRTAEQLGCHHIVMGTARTQLADPHAAGLGDASRAASTPRVPVEVVVGPAVSRLERWGLPAGVGLGVGGLLWVVLAD